MGNACPECKGPVYSYEGWWSPFCSQSCEQVWIYRNADLIYEPEDLDA